MKSTASEPGLILHFAGFLEKLRELMIKDEKPGGFGIFCDQGIHIDLLGIYSRQNLQPA